MARWQSVCCSVAACEWLLGNVENRLVSGCTNISNIVDLTCFLCLETFAANLSFSPLPRETELNLVHFCNACDCGHMVKELVQLQHGLVNSFLCR